MGPPGRFVARGSRLFPGSPPPSEHPGIPSVKKQTPATIEPPIMWHHRSIDHTVRSQKLAHCPWCPGLTGVDLWIHAITEHGQYQWTWLIDLDGVVRGWD